MKNDYFDIRKKVDNLYKKINKLKDEEIEENSKKFSLIMEEAKILNDELLKIKNDNLAGLEYLEQFLNSSKELKRLISIDTKNKIKRE